MDLRAAIKQRAVPIGFDLVGIAPARAGSDLDFARDWLDRGYAGEMRYLANSKRFNPRSVLPSVRSVICVGMVYNTPFLYSAEAREGGIRSRESAARRQASAVSSQLSVDEHDGPRTTDDGCAREVARAWVSRYAWGRDYHPVMRGKLEKLRAAIEGLTPGIETRAYVDTGPVIERAFARFSGVGWMGKNTCIINEEKGSWLFLGVILTNLQLEPDLPAPDRCGTCRACLDACPTGALVEPYVMDASRCVSYLTIELKGSIPWELRSGVGVNIFGCDICQDVCPWNAKNRIQEPEVRSQESSFQPMAVSYQPSAVSVPGVENGKAKTETGGGKLGIADSAVGQPRPAHVALEEARSPGSGHRTGNFNREFVFDNRQSTAPGTQRLEASTFSLFNPPLEALASLNEDDFLHLFVHSPIKRAKYRGWLRNLCVAIGNSGDARFVPKLKELAAHPDPVVREHAEWALSRLGVT